MNLKPRNLRMRKKYYLQDEYSLSSCECIDDDGICGVDRKTQTRPLPQQRAKHVSPVRQEILYEEPRLRQPQPSSRHQITEVIRPPATVIVRSTKSAEGVAPCRLMTACVNNIANEPINHVKVCQEINANREVLAGQFPCPCMLVDNAKDDLWNLQMSKWWGWNWLKNRENVLRSKLEGEGRRFSDEYPIYMANYFTNRELKPQPQQDNQSRAKSKSYSQPQAFTSEISQQPSAFGNQPPRQPSQYSQNPQLKAPKSMSQQPSKISAQPPRQQSQLQRSRIVQSSQSPYYKQSQHSQTITQPKQSQYSQAKPSLQSQPSQSYSSRARDPMSVQVSGTSQQKPERYQVECGENDDLVQLLEKEIYDKPPSKKKKSFVCSLIDSMKAYRKKPEVCQCTKDLDVCGPNKKPCGGEKGYIVPCGLECICEEDKSCLAPHLDDICPCEGICRCPREKKQTNTNTQSRGVGNFELCSLSNEACECPPASEIPNKDVMCSCGTTEICGTTNSVERMEMTYTTVRVTDTGDDCCCSCDEDLCDCYCCNKKLDMTNTPMQTSRFRLRENCTQTDTIVKKRRCCRCCKCCNKRGQMRCTGCIKKTDGQCYERPKPPKSPKPPHPPADKGIYEPLDGPCRPKPTDYGSSYQNSHSTKYLYYYPTQSERPRYETGKRTKTVMVRANSVQCLPAQENKATCCSCDEKLSPRYRRVNRFLSELHATNYDKIKAELLGKVQKESIKLEASDISAMTSAKLRNLFLEGDVYSSPVTGRNYDLSYRNIDINTKIPKNNSNIKPLDINEQLEYSKLSTQCFASEVEHTKLMTSICEAILSNRDDRRVTSKTPNETLRTINEDNENANDDIREFDDKIEKLEQKIAKLMSDNKSTRQKCRSANVKSPRKIVTDNLRQKSGDCQNDALNKYENLLTDNQKCVDDLLRQLETLHEKTSKKDDCQYCFDESVNLLGTGEHVKQSNNNFCSARNAQGETINDSGENFFGPSTSFTGKSNMNSKDADTAKTDDTNLNLDFSGIVFNAQTTPHAGLNTDKIVPSSWMTSQNFITQNLPSFTTNITHCCAIEKLLRNDDANKMKDGQAVNENFSLMSDSSSSNSGSSMAASPNSSSLCNNETVELIKK